MEQSNQQPVTVDQLDGFVEQYRSLKECIEEQERQTGAAREELDKLGYKIMAILKTLNRKNYKSEAGTFTIVEKTRVSIPQTNEDKEALFRWLRDRGLYEAYATVNSNAINSLFNEEYEQVKRSGDPEQIMNFSIPGLSQPKVHEIISFRRSTK